MSLTSTVILSDPKSDRLRTVSVVFIQTCESEVKRDPGLSHADHPQTVLRVRWLFKPGPVSQNAVRGVVLLHEWEVSLSFSDPLQHALDVEASRLRVAELWARANPSKATQNYNTGRQDRLNGVACRSANGSYLDGWYSVKGKQ